MTGKDQDARRYEPARIEPGDESTHAAIIGLTGSNRKVLEIGTSTGYISRVLTEKGNQVTGVEIDEQAASSAREYCDRLITGDIEQLKLEDLLGPASFDVIVFGDVLEHLKEPAAVLEKVKPYLKASGHLVVSLPNIGHGDIILNLIQDRFVYTGTGLLDRTHLKFFTLTDAIKLFDQCGYAITDLQIIKADIGTTEQELDVSLFPSVLVELVRSLPSATVYQFVFKAFPKDKQEIKKASVPPLPALDKLFEQAKDKRIAQLEEEIVRLTQETSKKDLIIQEIHDSRSWKLLQSLHRLRGRPQKEGSKDSR